MAMTKTPKVRYDMQFKLIVVGDTCVGKSCILLRYVDDMFKLTFISTIGKPIASPYAVFSIICGIVSQ